MRPELCAEALRLGRLLAGLMPAQPEVHGLVALMELQASRLRARASETGDPLLLADQDRRRWDRLLIRRGLDALRRASQLGEAPGPYEVQAEIAACHARAVSVADTDWERVCALYTVRGHLTPAPVVELNRAVAVAMAYGPARGLEIADRVASSLPGYVQLPAVRGDLLFRLGRLDEARAEFTRAASVTANETERALYRARAAECGLGSPARSPAAMSSVGRQLFLRRRPPHAKAVTRVAAAVSRPSDTGRNVISTVRPPAGFGRAIRSA